MGLSTPSLFARAKHSSGFIIRREISLGTLVQIVGVLISSIWFVARFEGQMQFLIENQARAAGTIEEIRIRVDRMEKYLSTKDVNYWRAAKTLEEETHK